MLCKHTKSTFHSYYFNLPNAVLQLLNSRNGETKLMKIHYKDWDNENLLFDSRILLNCHVFENSRTNLFHKSCHLFLQVRK